MRSSGNRRGLGLGVVSSVLAALCAVVPLPGAGAPVAAAAPGVAGLTRVGGEVLVNERTAKFQRQPDVSAATDGRVLVVWQDGDHTVTGVHPPGAVVSGRYVDARGRPEGASRMLMGKASDQGINLFQNPQMAASPFFPSIFLTTAFYWSDPGTPIMGQLEFVTQATAPVSSLQPTAFGAFPFAGDIALLPGGNYAVATTNGDIVVDLVDASGVTYVNDVVVNAQSGTAGTQSEPAVATGAIDQRLVVAFTDGDDIRVVTTNEGASPLTNHLVASSGVQRSPDVAGIVWGDSMQLRGYVVVFVDETAVDGAGTAIRAQFVAGNGAAGPVINVNATTAGDQTDPTATALPDGRVFVAWTDASGTEGFGGSGTAVRGRLLSVNGTQLAAAGDEMLVNTYTAGDQNEPAVATTSDGLISVVWTSASGALDPDSTGISLQTLDPRAQADTKIEPLGMRCFAVAGEPGDLAIVNLTPVEADAPGHGQLIGSGVGVPPVASNVNFRLGSVDPNVAVTPIGPDGQVCYANSEHANVHLVADHLATINTGYFVPGSSNGGSVRRIDTRSGLGGGKIAPSGRVCFSGGGRWGEFAVVNLTPVEATGLGNGQLVPSDVVNPPVASNVNFGPGTVDPNVAIAQIGRDGSVCFVNSTHASVHLVADQLGTLLSTVFRTAGADGAPVRVLDTRSGGPAGKVVPSGRVCFPVSGNPGELAVINLTPVEAEGLGNGQLISSDLATPPVASNVNFRPGSFDPNVAITVVGADRRVCFVNSVHTRVHVVADDLGSFPAVFRDAASPIGGPVRVVDTRPLALGANILVSPTVIAAADCTATTCAAMTWGDLSWRAVTYDRGSAAEQAPGPQSSGDGSFRSVDCLASGVCVGSVNRFTPGSYFMSAQILRSIDGGRSWQVAQQASELLGGVRCATEQFCLVGSRAGVLRSVDGGATWTAVAVPTLGVVFDIDCPTSTACFATADDSVVASADGGQTWTTVLPGVAPLGLGCSSATTCAVTTAAPSIVRTADGGASWSTTPASPLQYPTIMRCVGAACLAAAAYDGPAESSHPNTARMLLSLDGGATWEAVVVPAGGSSVGRVFDIECRIAECVVAGGTTYDVGFGAGVVAPGFVSLVPLPA